jgi:hypothetical protein
VIKRAGDAVTIGPVVTHTHPAVFINEASDAAIHIFREEKHKSDDSS